MCQSFPGHSSRKLKSGHVDDLLNDINITNCMTGNLRKNNCVEYSEIVTKTLRNFKARIIIKLHHLHNYLDFLTC